MFIRNVAFIDIREIVEKRKLGKYRLSQTVKWQAHFVWNHCAFITDNPQQFHSIVLIVMFYNASNIKYTA